MRLQTTDVAKSVLQENNICSTQYRQYAILTAFRQHEVEDWHQKPLVLIDLDGLLDAVNEKAPSEHEIDTKNFMKVRDLDVLHPAKQPYDIMSMCECMGQVLMLLRNRRKETYIVFCDGDELCFKDPSSEIDWLKLCRCMVRSGEDFVAINNPLRIQMFALRAPCHKM